MADEIKPNTKTAYQISCDTPKKSLSKLQVNRLNKVVTDIPA